MSKLTERLRRVLHADDRLDREMAAEWEDAPAGQPAPLPPQEEEADETAEQPDWWITVPFRQGKGLRRLLVVLSVLLCVGIIGILVITAQYLPPFGHPENPANNEVSRRYIENGMEETGAVNGSARRFEGLLRLTDTSVKNGTYKVKFLVTLVDHAQNVNPVTVTTTIRVK